MSNDYSTLHLLLPPSLEYQTLYDKNLLQGRLAGEFINAFNDANREGMLPTKLINANVLLSPTPHVLRA